MREGIINEKLIEDELLRFLQYKFDTENPIEIMSLLALVQHRGKILHEQDYAWSEFIFEGERVLRFEWGFTETGENLNLKTKVERLYETEKVD